MADKISVFFETYFKQTLIILLIGAIIYVCSGPLNVFNDSDGYIDMHIIRKPVYSLLLQLLYFKNFGLPLVFFQITSICISVYLLINNLKRNIVISPFLLFALTFFLLLPCLFNMKIANSVLSEAISYSLYLLVFHFLLQGFFLEKTKFILRAVPVLFLLLLTRSQFIYLIPIALVLIVWLSIRHKSFSKNIVTIILICALPFLTSLTDRVYHKVVNNHFVTTAWTGLHIFSPALFVANASDANIYQDENERNFYTKVYSKLWERKLNIHHPDLVEINTTSIYREKYTRIANWTIYDFGKEQLGSGLSENEKFIALEKITSSMTVPLILKNFKDWAKLNLHNFLAGFKTPYIPIIYGIFLIFCGRIIIIGKATNEIKLVFFASLLALANVATVAIGIHTIDRFTFYNDWVFFLMFFIFLNLLTMKKTSSKTSVSL